MITKNGSIRERKTISIFALLTLSIVLVLASTAFTQVHNPTITPPWAWGISSDFGPRLLAASPFHGGIDYSAPEHATINALEAGTISSIGYSVNGSGVGAGWRIYITGNSGCLGYYHTFSDAPGETLESGIFTLVKSVTLKNLSNNNEYQNQTVILVKNGTGPDTDIIAALSQYGNCRILDWEGQQLPDDEFPTTNIVAAGTAIAPVGDSGTNEIHLHIEYWQIYAADQPKLNPLYNVIHGNGAMAIDIQQPAANAELKEDDFDNYHFKVGINSTGCLDINEVILSIDDEDNGNVGTFNYAGQPNENTAARPTVLISTPSYPNSGVEPENGTPGNDIFHYFVADLNTIAEVDLRPGSRHTLHVKAVDVNGNPYTVQQDFTIEDLEEPPPPPPPPPELIVDIIGPSGPNASFPDHEWSVNVAGGSGDYSYGWFRDYSLVSIGSSYTVEYLGTKNPIRLEVAVIDVLGHAVSGSDILVVNPTSTTLYGNWGPNWNVGVVGGGVPYVNHQSGDLHYLIQVVCTATLLNGTTETVVSTTDPNYDVESEVDEYCINHCWNLDYVHCVLLVSDAESTMSTSFNHTVPPGYSGGGVDPPPPGGQIEVTVSMADGDGDDNEFVYSASVSGGSGTFLYDWTLSYEDGEYVELSTGGVSSVYVYFDWNGLYTIECRATDYYYPGNTDTGYDFYYWSGGIYKSGDLNSAIEIPTEYKLEQNYPNPFNPVTNIKYQLPEASPVTMVVYNISGMEVSQLVSGYEEAGFHEVTWEASGMASGMYFCRINAGRYTKTMKMLLVR
jgi:murein DD-endopeptidase MepM/ murein hydrolase activator NlpD